MSRVLNLDSGSSKRKHRRSLEIVREMLAIASVKVKKTRIMYQANLSYRLLERYLNRLLESGMVECDGDSFYSITRKGKEFVQLYENYVARRRRIGEELRGVRRDRLLLENLCFNNGCNSKEMMNRKEVLCDITAE